MSEERRRRAQRRRRTEEIMGWVCVPLIVMIGWFAWRGWEEIVAERQPSLREAVMPANVTAAPPRP